MSSREASPLQSDATSADSLHADDTAECRDVATGAGVQVQSQQLQDAPEGATPHVGLSFDEFRAWYRDAGVRHVTSDAAPEPAPEPALFAAALRAENDDEHEYVVEIDGPVLSATIDAPWAPESPAVTAADTVGDEVVARLGDGESPSLSPARGRSRLQQMFADVTNSIYRECQEKALGADWVIAPASGELPDERIAFVPTDAAWKRHDEQLALRTGLALLTNEEHTQVAAWVSMRTAGRS